MESSPTSSRTLKVLVGTLAAVLLVIVLLIAPLALLDANHLRAPLTRYVSARTGRQIRIDGPLEAHLLSLHPSLVAEHVTIGNPPWAPAGAMAEIGKLTVVFDLPSLSHSYTIRRLEMDDAHLHFRRDLAGHANWLWIAPGILPGKGIPIIYELSAPEAHVDIDDDRRHLMFDGFLSAGGRADTDKAFRITGKGRLNGRQVTLAIEGDPLAAVTREKPYHFTFDESSSGSHLSGHGLISRPFDLRTLDGAFEADGEDLKDLHFLLGANLPDTGAYRLSGKFARRGNIFKLLDLLATSGESDLRVALTSEMDDSGHSHLDVDLNSQRLRFADLGARAAGRTPAPSPDEKPALLPDTPLHLEGIRVSDYEVNFHARQIDTAKLSFRGVAGKMTIDHGNILVPHLSASVASVTSAARQPAVQPEGKLSARIELDAKTDEPKAHIDLRLANLGLGQFARKDPTQPPLDGLLQGRLDLTGRGRSIHDLAAKADGAVTLVLPQGAIRASLAELTGIDFRGLGLMLTQNKDDTPVRCGVARFRAHDGTLTAQTLVIDTDPVLITGSGTIQLDSESLDLQFQGHPKHLRLLRLSAPIIVQGTLAHPSMSLEKSHRKLELVDPGHAKDADCGALLAEAKTGALLAEEDAAPSAAESSTSSK